MSEVIVRVVEGVGDEAEFRAVDFPTFTKLLDDDAAVMQMTAYDLDMSLEFRRVLFLSRRRAFSHVDRGGRFARAIVAADIGETEPARQAGLRDREAAEIGRASCRERV